MHKRQILRIDHQQDNLGKKDDRYSRACLWYISHSHIVDPPQCNVRLVAISNIGVTVQGQYIFSD